VTPYIPKKIFIEDAVKDLPLTRRILSRCSAVPTEIISRAKELIHASIGKLPRTDVLLLCRNKGRFIEPCPGTSSYLCCGYTILNTGTGCPLTCSYCVLQAYLNNPFITLYANLDEMWDEFAANGCMLQQETLRIGTGEYGDSLALEHLTDFIPSMLLFLGRKRNAVLELKTKTTHIEPLLGQDHGGKVIVSWSLNAEEIALSEEHGAALIADRIKAAGRLAAEGYRIGFHFDPLIAFTGWEQGYKRTVDMIASHVPASSIAWVSLGALRYMPQLKNISRQRFSASRIFTGEFVPGLDGKMRYFQPIRIELFARLAALLRAYSPDIFIYLCMESPLVWQQALGFAPSSNADLKRMLDERVKT
jgi:spore photoproduct lyase